MTDDSDWGLSMSNSPDNPTIFRWLTYVTIGTCLIVAFAILFTFLL